MSMIRVLSAVEQVAGRLREELMRELWGGLMPGVDRLAEDLGVSRKTVEAAVQILEGEGLLIPQGVGRRRRIVLPTGEKPEPALRVAILLNEPVDRRLDYMVEIQHEFLKAGHTAFYPDKCLSDLGMDPRRVARMVEQNGADAWVVLGGSSEVLAWFAAQPVPAFAIFGRRRGLRLPGVGPDKAPAMAAATRALIRCGHRRIVLLARTGRRLPKPGASERAFLSELAAAGISPGSYHLPDWEVSIKGFHARLESLFRLTPPTALVIQEAAFYVAALQFCANRGLRVPEDVSLVCTDADPNFGWCQPSVAHIRWDTGPVIRRVVGWAANVGKGKADLRQTLTKAEFVEGGTIGPAKG
jgi:DNA-binding LacI/PurR family transcriptional regulator/biotin operon repressor